MALPSYDKSKRMKSTSFELLPKGAYVIVIKNVKQEPNRKSGIGEHLAIAFDIAEGQYKGFYEKQYKAITEGEKRWPGDAVFYLSIPENDSPDWMWRNWNTFFADLEDSNNGFAFSGDITTLRGKLIGGKFYNNQSQSKNGTVYDHTQLKWTCVAADVRNGKPGVMPKDNLVKATGQVKPEEPSGDVPEWMEVGEEDADLPF